MVNDVSYELLRLFLRRGTGNGIGKFLRGLEQCHLVSRNEEGRVGHEVASGFGSATLEVEGSEVAEVDGFSLNQGALYRVYVRFDNAGYGFSVNTGLLRNTLDDISFSHVYV